MILRHLYAAGFCLVAAPALSGTLTLQSLLPETSERRVMGVIPGPSTTPDTSYVLHLNGHIDIWNTGGAAPTTEGHRLLNDKNRPKGLKQAFGLAFDPQFGDTGHVYLSYADSRGRNRLVRYTARTKPNGEIVLDGDTMHEVLRIQSATGKTNQSHFGGAIAFGPDGYLYMTTGDSNADPTGLSVSQQTDSLLGKVLRIDPTGDDFAKGENRNYAIPVDNPDFGPNAAGELWATGLRNPYAASFDFHTGRLFIPDVGEVTHEEINIGMAGANYGWSAQEGDFDFGGELTDQGILTDPIWQYDRGDGTFEGYSVIGGDVYRGALEALDGQYVFGDFVPGADGAKIWSFDAEADTLGEGDVTAWDLEILGGDLGQIIAFGRDSQGRLYVSDFDGDLFLVTGATLDAPPGAGGSRALSAAAGPTPVPLPATIVPMGIALATLRRFRVKC